MSEVLVWTVVFFGGNLLVVLALLALAVRKDLTKARDARSTAD